MVSWVVELSEYDIQYVLRTIIKLQALAYSMEDLNSHVDEDMPLEWKLYIDGASNIKGSGDKIIMGGTADILIK